MGKKIEQSKSFLKYEVAGLVLLAVAIVTGVRVGWLGTYLDYLFLLAAGNWHWLLSVFLGYLALFIMVKRTPPRLNRHMAGLVLLLSVILTWDHLNLYTALRVSHNNVEPNMVQETVKRIGRLHDNLSATAGGDSFGQPVSAGGGLIGLVFFLFAHKLFDTLGLLIVLLIGGLISLILITGKSFVSFLAAVKQKLFSRGEAVGRRMQSLLADAQKIKMRGKEKEHSGGRMEAEETAEEKPEKRWGLLPPKKWRKRLEKNALPAEEEENVDRAVPPLFHDFSEQLQEKGEKRLAEVPSAAVSSQGPHMETLPQQGMIRVRFPVEETSQKEKKAESIASTAKSSPPYQLPPLSLLSLPKGKRPGTERQDVMENAKKLEQTLESFGVQVRVSEVHRGPTVTRYEVTPAVGVKVSRIVSLSDDLALALAAKDIRMEAPIPGKSAIGIEVPNKEIAIVSLREVLESEPFQQAQELLTIALGRDISGTPIVGNLAKMPHLLVAGATGAGKSVCINGIIASILFRAKPDEVKFLMVDPKMVELNVYNGIPHLLAPVVTDPRRAAFALKKVVAEMEHRYERFAKEGARNLEGYNSLLAERGEPLLPYIVVIVDELADLMMVAPGDVEDAICRLAQMARAAGIHLIIATQRPSVDVITGVIKANIPSRIAFAVSSHADSRTILDTGGAEKLLGRGDMLYLPVGEAKPIRVQGAFLSDAEVERIVSFVQKQRAETEYSLDLSSSSAENEKEDRELDPLFYEAVKLVVESEQASVSMIQRRLKVGYARAARLIDQMEEKGYVGPFEGSRPREVLLTKEQWAQLNKNGMPLV